MPKYKRQSLLDALKTIKIKNEVNQRDALLATAGLLLQADGKLRNELTIDFLPLVRALGESGLVIVGEEYSALTIRIAGRPEFVSLTRQGKLIVKAMRYSKSAIKWTTLCNLIGGHRPKRRREPDEGGQLERWTY